MWEPGFVDYKRYYDSESCKAYFELRKYSETGGDEKSENEILTMLSINDKVGLDVFIDMRFACATVRLEENKMTCTIHVSCMKIAAL